MHAGRIVKLIFPQSSHKPGILGEFSEPGKHTKLSGNSAQFQSKTVTNKIMSLYVVSVVQKCSKIRLQLGLGPGPRWGVWECPPPKKNYR